MSHFYGTENEIWAGFEPIGVLKISDWAVKYARVQFFMFLLAKQIKKKIL